MYSYLDDADDDVFEARAVRVVVQHKGPVLGPLCAPEAGGSHPWVQRAKVIVQGIQILKSFSQHILLN